MHKIRINLANMTCKACDKLAKIKISKIAGVNDVRIDDIGGKTEILATREIPLDEIQDALSETNYKATKL